MKTVGTRACSFTRFLFFKGGNLFEIQEKLFVSLFVRKEDTTQKDELKPIITKKGGKKKTTSVGFGKELRLQLEETNQFVFLDTFSKKEKSKLFMGLIKGNFFLLDKV